MLELSVVLATRCPTCSAARALPLALFLLLLDVAAGGQLVLVALDRRGDVTRGFVKLTTVLYLLTAGLAALVLLAAPLSAYQRLYGWQASWTGVAYAGFLLFGATILGRSVILFRRTTAGSGVRAVAWLGAGAAVLGSSALVGSLASSISGSAAITLTLIATALSVGAVSTGMLLGHWYLVTPTLTAAPLQWTIGLLLLAVAAQAGAFAIALVALSPGSEGPGALVRPYAGVTALWVLAGVTMPLVAGGLAWWTCRLRSFMSTTGLLYLAMASVLAGQILGAELLLLVVAA
jgi:hypothetical protein